MSQVPVVKTAGTSRWMVLIAVTAAFTFTFMGRYIWSPLMSSVSQEFGFSATQAGLYMSAFFAGYLLTQIPSGIMSDRFQPKYIIIVCTLLGGLMTSAMYLMKSYEMGLLLRVIAGISGGCIMSGCSKIIAVNFVPSDRTSAMGVLLASPPIGITLANMVGPVLNQHFGWRGTFLTVGMLSLAVAGLVLLFVGEIPKAAQPAGSRGLLQGLQGYFSDRNQWILGVSGFMFMAVAVGFATWCNAYAQNQLGLKPAQGGFVITCYSMAGIVGSCMSGSIAKRLKLPNKTFLLLALGGMAVLTILFSLQKSYPGLILVGLCYGFCSYLPSTHYTTLCMTMAHDSYAATAISSQNLIIQLSSVIQPAVLGGILDMTGNYQLIWYAFVICIAISMMFCLIFPSAPAAVRQPR